jgi:hypothetical protein
MKRIFGFTGFAERKQADRMKEKYNRLINFIMLKRF